MGRVRVEGGLSSPHRPRRQGYFPEWALALEADGPQALEPGSAVSELCSPGRAHGSLEPQLLHLENGRGAPHMATDRHY